MRRVLIIAFVIATALAVTSATAGAAGPRRGVIFYLHSGGFFVEGRSALGSDRIRFRLDRHGEAAYYYVPARLGAGTVRARFGRLGSLDLRFRPDRGDGPLGCGDSEGWQQGAFVGSLVFRGEHDYASIDADRARGWFRTRPAGTCPRRGGDRPAALAAASRAAPVAETGAELYGKTASRLPARVFYFFTRAHMGTSQVVCDAFKIERREGMLVERGDEVYAGAATFDWDLGRETARVEPPAPFTGRAFYRRARDGGPARWTGSLRAPVLGGAPMRLTGAAFDARLVRQS